MSVVDVSELVRNKEIIDKKSELIDKKIFDGMKEKMKPPKKRFIIKNRVGNPRPMMPHFDFANFAKIKEEETELKGGVKNTLLFLASKPIKADKQAILYAKLHNSKFLNSFIDNNIYTKYIDNFNDNLKCVVCYGYHYVSALKE